MGKRKLVALRRLSFWCHVTVIILCLFLTVPRVGMLCLIVVNPDHTCFLTQIQLVDILMVFLEEFLREGIKNP